MAPEVISALVGTGLSLIFNYVPGLAKSYDRLAADWQRLVMAVLLLLAVIGLAAWRCAHGDCTSWSWDRVAASYLAALVANQGVDRISPKGGTGRSNTT